MVFCYGGKLQATPENCVELLQVADEFGLPKLKILCELYIGQSMDMDNIDEVENIATIYSATRLKQYCEHMRTDKDKCPLFLTETDMCEMIVEKY